MSCVFLNIDPHPLSARPVCVHPPLLLRGGGHTRQGERGVGVNILEDARHSLVLYLYQILFGRHTLDRHKKNV
jgi:hypothetical protein